MKKEDIILTIVLVVVYVPLSLWGGWQSWAGAADMLPFIMLVVGAIYLIFESFRYSSPLLGGCLGILVGLAMIGPSLIFYREELEEILPIFLILAALGWSLSGIVQERKMKKLSKGFFLGSVAVWLGLAVILLIVGNFIHSDILIILSYVLMLFVAGVMMTLFYKMWASIQEGYARTSPGKAIGFLFIPFFNIYWAFQAICFFSKDYNSFVDRHSVDAPRLPECLFLAFTILIFTTWIPVIGLLLLFVNYFIGLAMVLKICDGVNALPAISG